MKQERIKDRVLKRAARAWGFSDVEMETSFDPVVSMLLNALSYELEKVANDLEDSRTRVVERVLEIMFPEVSSGAKPCRAIMHALPVENNLKVSLQNQMSITRRIHDIYNPLVPIHKEVVLSPTLEVKLSHSRVAYLAYERNLFKISNLFNKDAVNPYNHVLEPGIVYLGLENTGDEGIYLDDLMLYVDIKNTHQKEIFHYYLKQMKCYYFDREIQVELGYNVPSDVLNVKNIISKNYTNLSEIMQEVNSFYRDNFVTLKGSISTKSDTLSNHDHERFEEAIGAQAGSVIWLKLVFPESLIPQIIDNVSFATNCFPVINKRRHVLNKTIGNFLSYVALETDNNIFLDLESVVDGLENHYEIKEFKGDILEEGNAVLRHGGVSRFDSRSASELLQNVLDLLKDESSSFAGLGKDFMNSSLVEINQLLASVEQQAKESSFAKNNDPYLMIKPKSDEAIGKSFAIQYWSTCAHDGNDIKAGTLMHVKDDLYFMSKETMLMTTTVGGVNKQNNKDRILAYRNALLTRGRIVTFADIKAFANDHFKDRIKNIKIERGTRKEISVNAGFSRTIDIYLELNPDEMALIRESEWNYLCDSFLKKLSITSANVFPYRLFVDQLFWEKETSA